MPRGPSRRAQRAHEGASGAGESAERHKGYFESVRKLVVAERERRAHLIATIATVLEIATLRVPILPEQLPRIHARHLGRSRNWARSHATRPP